MTEEKSWSGGCLCAPGSLCALLGSPQQGEGRPSGRVWAYGFPRDPAWLIPVPNPRKGWTEGTSQPRHPYPTTWKAHSPNSKGKRKQSLHGKAFHKWGLWVSPSPCTSGLAESPLKPLVLKLVWCLVLINELRVPTHKHSPGQGLGRMQNPVNWREEPSCQVPSSLRTGQWAWLPSARHPHQGGAL